MKNGFNLRTTLFFSLTALVSLFGVPIYWYINGFSPWLFFAFLITAFLTNLSITAGYHRYLAHKSYDSHPFLKLLYLLWGASAFQSSALWWASNHRRHHQYVDTDKDPHNIHEGFFHAHLGWLFFMDDRKEDSLAFAPDLAKDPLVAWQHRHYAVIAITMGFLLPLFVGWLFGVPMGGLLFCGFLRIVASNHCTFLINSLAHTLGSRPYSDSQTARDSWIMAFLACGEGYHNFHHAFAADYRNGIHWYHWDPTKWWIRGVSFLGLASRLKVVPMPDILRARMQNDYSVLVKKGIPVDHLQNIKKQFEEAHDRFRRLGAEYNRVKRNMKEKSHERFVSIRAEFRVAKSDLKTAWSRWSFYTKNFRVILLR